MTDVTPKQGPPPPSKTEAKTATTTTSERPPPEGGKPRGSKRQSRWRRLANRFQKTRHDDDEHDDDAAVGATDTTIVDAAVEGLRSLASTSDDRDNHRHLRTALHPLIHDDDDEYFPESPEFVSLVERSLRQVFFTSFCFVLGASLPALLPLVRKITEYSGVAWATCLCILVGSRVYRKRRRRSVPATVEDLTGHDIRIEQHACSEGTPLLSNTRKQADHLRTSGRTAVLSVGTSARDLMSDYDHSSSQQGETPPPPPPRAAALSVDNLFQSVHPSLDRFLVIDMVTNCRISCNGKEGYSLSNDFFEGKMMIMIRTPNTDDPAIEPGLEDNELVTKYMTGKQRRFEFQFQIKLKKVPQGRVYFACEVGEVVRMGVIQRAFISAAMAFVKTTNNNFHYSMMGSPKSDDGNYEKPHMAFPVEEGMNRLVATPPDQPLPVLGEEVIEDPESIKARKKGVQIKWNLEDTYTMSLWSAYMDFLEWHCCNLPGIRPFGLHKLFGRQPLHLTLYEIPFDKEADKHNRCDIESIVELELSHEQLTGPGELAQKWKERNAQSVVEVELTKLEGAAAEEVAVDEDYLEEEEDEDAAAELGEGIYVRCGDVVTLRESSVEKMYHQTAFVANGGGFAVLQEQNSCRITIEKSGRNRRRGRSSKSSLIKSGDTVLVKMVGEDNDAKFLSLHRGWWLKWVASVPTKNGFFTIHAHERSKSTVLSNGTSYLTLDGSFYLRHKRWSKYIVGVCREGSTTYGGRMLGLHNPTDGKEGNSQAVGMGGHDEDSGPDDDLNESEEKRAEHWMCPLYLEVCDAPSAPLSVVELKASSEERKDDDENHRRVEFSSEGSRMDVSAWLEIMNRAERVRQLVYVVRVVEAVDSGVEGEEAKTSEQQHRECYMRLRTGRELSRVMRAGLMWRNRETKVVARPRRLSIDVGMFNSNSAFPASPRTEEVGPISRQNSFDEIIMGSESQSFMDSDASDSCSDDDLMFNEALEDPESSSDDAQYTRARKSRLFIGKLARTVKDKTATTGKKVVRQGMKVGKGTVNAGKAIITGRSRNNPPSKEPRSGKPRTRRKVERDLHVRVSTRTMKKMERAEGRSDVDDVSMSLTGELSAPEQSCRNVSNMLYRMSSVPGGSAVAAEFSALLSTEVQPISQVDKGFLQGGAVELGVTPKLRKSVVYDCLVARCLWESHWREEWCAVHDAGIAFFAPLSNEPCLEISFKDIQGVRMVDARLRSPLPGCSILAIETAWLCHYVAVSSDDARKLLKSKMDSVANSFRRQSFRMSDTETELWKARLWQGLQDSSLSSARGKWSDVHCGQKMKRRVILNNRRMAFDLPPLDLEVSKFAEGLLASSLSFDLETIQHHPEALSTFLDNASVLRGLPLHDLDRADTKTFCSYVNVYHCLLQHALLVTASGPLHKRSCDYFMRTSCYEIGGAVFSLAELNNCIIRGNMSRPNPPRAPYIDAPKKSNAYRFFGLPNFSPNVNFLLNTGDTSCPNKVPVLQSEHLDGQLAVATSEFLRRNVTVDPSKKLVTIPKVCEVFRNDFPSDPSTSSAHACLKYCLRYLDESIASKIYALLGEEGSVTVKYRGTVDQYHSRLGRKTGDYVAEFKL